MVHLVCFHLASDNPQFMDALKSMGNWSNRLPGAWILETRLSPRQVRDNLGSHLGPADRLFVARITRQWAGRGMGTGFQEWMDRRTEWGTEPTGANGR